MKWNYDSEDENSIGKDWKEHWRALEEDPDSRRATRQEKRAERRRIHKQIRRVTKQSLDYED